MKANLEYRETQKQVRQKALLESASLPPRMQQLQKSENELKKILKSAKNKVEYCWIPYVGIRIPNSSLHWTISVLLFVLMYNGVSFLWFICIFAQRVRVQLQSRQRIVALAHSPSPQQASRSNPSHEFYECTQNDDKKCCMAGPVSTKNHLYTTNSGPDFRYFSSILLALSQPSDQKWCFMVRISVQISDVLGILGHFVHQLVSECPWYLYSGPKFGSHL